MTGMFDRQQGTQARLYATPPFGDPIDCAAAQVGITDAAKPGIRARLYLLGHPRLLKFVRRIFGFTIETPLAATRAEAIRRFALGEVLAGRSASPGELVRRWQDVASEASLA